MPDWTDTIEARQRGEHADFFDVNTPLEDQGDEGRAAAGLPPAPRNAAPDENPDLHEDVHARVGAAGTTAKAKSSTSSKRRK